MAATKSTTLEKRGELSDSVGQGKGLVGYQATMGKIYGRICDIMAEVQAIGKEQKNVAQNYKYRGIDDVYNDLHVLFAKHRVFSVIADIKEIQTKEFSSSRGSTMFKFIVPVTYRFYTDDGSYIDSGVIGSGMDTGDKEVYKALAGAHKYAIMQLLMIPTDEPKDAEMDSPETGEGAAKGETVKYIGKADETAIKELCMKNVVAQEVFYRLINEWFGKEIQKLSEIPVSMLEHIRFMVREYGNHHALATVMEVAKGLWPNKIEKFSDIQPSGFKALSRILKERTAELEPWNEKEDDDG